MDPGGKWYRKDPESGKAPLALFGPTAAGVAYGNPGRLPPDEPRLEQIAFVCAVPGRMWRACRHPACGIARIDLDKVQRRIAPDAHPYGNRGRTQT